MRSFMKKIDRRHFFKTSAFAALTTLFSSPSFSGESACKTAAKKVEKKKFAGYSTEYVQTGKLGYTKESPEAKATKGKLCSNCKHYCEEQKVCTLASMKIQKGKDKFFPLVHEKGYCNMFAWDSSAKKKWKSLKKT